MRNTEPARRVTAAGVRIASVSVALVVLVTGCNSSSTKQSSPAQAFSAMTSASGAVGARLPVVSTSPTAGRRPRVGRCFSRSLWAMRGCWRLSICPARRTQAAEQHPASASRFRLRTSSGVVATRPLPGGHHALLGMPDGRRRAAVHGGVNQYLLDLVDGYAGSKRALHANAQLVGPPECRQDRNVQHAPCLCAPGLACSRRNSTPTQSRRAETPS
jgi:hypothetical protein